MRIRLFALLGAAAAAGLASADPVSKALPEPPPAATKALPAGVDDLKAFQKHVHEVAEKVIPVTVCLQVNGPTGSASGSGVIVSEDGLILTAGHVIAGKPGRVLQVVMPDGKRYKGKVLGFDPKIDSGMAQITDPPPDGKKWPYAEIAPSKDLKAGQWVVATGHPGGYKKDRPPVVRVGRIGQPKFSPPREGGEFIQVDTTLVGGDSGGPLFDLKGRVIGIHSRIGNDPLVGPSIAQNMDVPSDRYKEAWDRLLAGDIIGGAPYFGVRMAEGADGCKLGDVTKGEAADRAGIKPGDVIVRFAGQEVGSYDEMVKVMKEQKPYAEVVVEVKREVPVEDKKDLKAKAEKKDPKAKDDDKPKDEKKDSKPKTETKTLDFKVTLGLRME